MLSQVCTALEAKMRLKGPPSDSGAGLLTSHVCIQARFVSISSIRGAQVESLLLQLDDSVLARHLTGP